MNWYVGFSCFLKCYLMKMCSLTPPCYSTSCPCLYNCQLRLEALHSTDLVTQSVCKLPTIVLGLQNYLRTVIIYLSHAPVSACFISWHDLLCFGFFCRVLFKLAFFCQPLCFETVEILIQYYFNPYLCYNY